MHVGIVAVAEPLASDGNAGRPFRAGMLAEAIIAAGGKVTWWTSNFDHVRKEYRHPPGAELVAEGGAHIVFLDGPAYARNVSLARIRNHAAVARAFRRIAHPENLDLLFVCVPTHELATAALDLGRERGIPVVIDIRDIWPEAFLSLFPRATHPLARLALAGAFRRARTNLERATHLVAVSETYLDWGLRLSHRERTSSDRVYPIGFPATSWEPEEHAISTPLTVVFAGTFGRSYDLQTAIEAFSIAEKLRPGALRLVLAGSGDQEAELRRRVGDSDLIQMTGWIDASSLRQVLTNSHLGIAAYHQTATQSLPNKPFEYWAAGLGILSSLQGELAAIIDRTGAGRNYLPGDAADLARVVVELVDDPDQVRSMRARGFKLFTSEYDADAIYPDLVEFLGEVARA